MNTLLQKTIHPNNLKAAWNDVEENGGVPGSDNITIAAWRRTWEARLVKLAQAVRSNQYKPSRLRIRTIPKTTPGQYRTLRIPTVTDRVLHRAILQQLMPLYDPHFLPCSCGYRPGRGVKDAVILINQLRKNGFVTVLDADIDDFFNQVDHVLLLRLLRKTLPDLSLMHLISQLLDTARPDSKSAKGIPMGSPLSPLLANILLHQFDQAITPHHPLVRYADDFIILAKTEDDIETAFHIMETTLHTLKLAIEPSKTQITSFKEGFDFLGVHFEETWYWYILNDEKIEIHDGIQDMHIHQYNPTY